MQSDEDLVRMRHMLGAAMEAVALSRGKGPREIASDRVLSLALVRLLEIVGEAARRVSDETREAHPEVPWSQIVGLRNRLIHGYDSVDLEILWRILSDDLRASSRPSRTLGGARARLPSDLILESIAGR
ncbi:MAG: DUF86 domain-containing protein [Thermoplasmata archaeon]|nr:DUF86 domain-containing protein [Thermoplasmata archaeon]